MVHKLEIGYLIILATVLTGMFIVVVAMRCVVYFVYVIRTSTSVGKISGKY